MRKLLALLFTAALAVIGVAMAAPASADSFICVNNCAAEPISSRTANT